MVKLFVMVKNINSITGDVQHVDALLPIGLFLSAHETVINLRIKGVHKLFVYRKCYHQY